MPQLLQDNVRFEELLLVWCCGDHWQADEVSVIENAKLAFRFVTEAAERVYDINLVRVSSRVLSTAAASVAS